MRKRNEINIRDPFVLTYEGKYYMYGTRGETCWGEADGFDVYIGNDLENWMEPVEIFHKPEGFWANMNYWAPEVYYLNGEFYLFASFKSPERNRGTQILKASSPTGPFEIYSDGPVTPENWECLDGTLYIDRNGVPYMIFCHEWTQIHDGEICMIELSKDLKKAVSKPKVLFKASEASWATSVKDNNYVTDGPFMFHCQGGDLIMLWSSFGKEGYTEAIARSDNGEITGNWVQESELLFKKDGGHGMLFNSLDGKLLLALHSPNKSLEEHPTFFEIIDENNKLHVKSELK